MSLQIKITWVLGLVLLGFAVLTFAVIRYEGFGSFVKLERESAIRDMRRWQAGLTAEADDLSLMAKDWANWDDTYEFVEDGNSEYIADNLADYTFELININLLAIVDNEGIVVFQNSFDLDSMEPLPLADFPAGQWTAARSLLILDSPQSERAGVMITSAGPMIVAARPIITTEGNGPVRGTLVMGRMLTGSVQEDINQRTHVAMEEVRTARPDDEHLDGAKWIADGEAYHLNYLSNDELHVCGMYSDVMDGPGLRLTARIDREITRQGRHSLYATVASVIAVGLLLLLVAIIYLNRHVVSRVGKLADFARGVASGGNLSLRYDNRGNDEIAHLGAAVNEMLNNLEQAQQALIASERRESELATMHRLTATYAHEINNPLTAVMALVQGLQEEECHGEDNLEMLADVHTCAIRIRDTVAEMQKITAPIYRRYTKNMDIVDLAKSH